MPIPSLKQFMQFAATGGVATGVQYLILVGLVELLGTPAVLASAMGYATSSLLNYLMKYHWVFASTAKHISALPRYLLISLTGLALNTGLMQLGLSMLDWHYLLVQVIVTGLVLLWNFFANAYWTFGQVC